MSFPNFKRKFFFFKQRDGWDDLGKKNSSYYIDDKGRIVGEATQHTFCQEVVSIGREDGKLFYFCGRCLVKTKENVKT